MDTKPRILFGVTADMSLSLMRGFPQYLASRGWDVHVVSSPGPGLDQLRAAGGVEAHALRMARDPSPLADLRSLVAWLRVLKKVRPDIISVGTPKAGLLGGIAAVVMRVPTRVYMLRGLRLETTSGMQRRILSVVEKISMGCAHVVLSVSQSLRQKAINLSLVKARKIVVLGAGSSNGVAPAEFADERFSSTELGRLKSYLGIAEGVPVVGFVGRLNVDKGLDVLASARAILEIQHVDYQLLIVGGIDGEGSGEGLTLLRRHGRAAIETGHVSEPAIYYQLMDVLCLPTLREGFPNVVLEAAAAGVPTVTTNATGAVDSVIAEVTGILAEVGSALALAKALGALIENRSLREELGRQARQRVINEFDRYSVWARQNDFYLRLSGSK